MGVIGVDGISIRVFGSGGGGEAVNDYDKMRACVLFDPDTMRQHFAFAAPKCAVIPAPLWLPSYNLGQVAFLLAFITRLCELSAPPICQVRSPTIPIHEPAILSNPRHHTLKSRFETSRGESWGTSKWRHPSIIVKRGLLFQSSCSFCRQRKRIMASYESNFVDGQLAGMEMAKAITFKHVWSRREGVWLL